MSSKTSSLDLTTIISERADALTEVRRSIADHVAQHTKARTQLEQAQANIFALCKWPSRLDSKLDQEAVDDTAEKIAAQEAVVARLQDKITELKIIVSRQLSQESTMKEALSQLRQTADTLRVDGDKVWANTEVRRILCNDLEWLAAQGQQLGEGHTLTAAVGYEIATTSNGLPYLTTQAQWEAWTKGRAVSQLSLQERYYNLCWQTNPAKQAADQLMLKKYDDAEKQRLSQVPDTKPSSSYKFFTAPRIAQAAKYLVAPSISAVTVAALDAVAF